MSPTLTPVASTVAALVAAALVGFAAGALAAAAITLTTVGKQLTRSRRDLSAARHALAHDPLTGLPNRRAVLNHLDTALDRGTVVAVAMLDLDRFKTVNDELGHRAGDELLCQVADRLRTLPAAVRLAARLQGDEFLLLIDGTDPAAVAGAAWHTVAAAPYLVAGGHHLTISASIGVAITQPSTEADTRPDVDHRGLLHDADLAMYRAKASGAGVVIADRHAPQPGQDRRAGPQRQPCPPPDPAPPTGHP